VEKIVEVSAAVPHPGSCSMPSLRQAEFLNSSLLRNYNCW
jgi:hypothetical protein